MREHTLARFAAACAALLFVVEGSCFLDRPGPNAGELAWGPLKLAIYQLLFAVRPQQVWNLRWPMLLVGAATAAVSCFLVRRMAGPWGLAATMLAFGAHIGFVAPAIPKALAAEVAPSR